MSDTPQEQVSPEFLAKLESHDWFYHFSDDRDVRQRGDAASNALLLEAAKSEAGQRAYNAAYAKRFHRKPFVEPYAFPFPKVQP